ncbi:MAG: ABC transporter ATP-binding protein [Candidatus Firestonebacteria bacterium]|nr:ABC transporter ATP-binding protein [Candidatus Firestonebacteria bacterium]
MNILEINGLSVEYYRGRKVIPALKGVSLAVEKGETLAIVGESGSGKSTLALSVMGLLFPGEGKVTTGKITYGGRNLLALGAEGLRSLRGKEISIVFQDPSSSLNPVLDIREQLLEAVEAHDTGLTSAEKNALLAAALDEVLLDGRERILSSYPHQLSGGQKQRIAIAMAIINRPKLLIADEPTTALDVTVQKEILDLLAKLKRELSLTILLITHNIPLAYERSDRIAVMHEGELVELGPREEVFRAPKHAYTAALIESAKIKERK